MLCDGVQDMNANHADCVRDGSPKPTICVRRAMHDCMAADQSVETGFDHCLCHIVAFGLTKYEGNSITALPASIEPSVSQIIIGHAGCERCRRKSHRPSR